VTTVNSNNPYLRVDNYAVILDAIARVLHSAPVTQSLRAQGVKGSYAVNANLTDNQGPIIDISDQASSAPAATHSAQLVMNEAGHRLDAMQAVQGTSPAYFITTQAIVPPTRATRVFSSALRRLFAVGFLDLLAVVVVGLIAEAVASRRAQATAATEAPPETMPVASAEELMIEPPVATEPARSLPAKGVPANGHNVIRLSEGHTLRLTRPARGVASTTRPGTQAGRKT
jgi:hypothetical protein